MANEFFKIWEGPVNHVIQALAQYLDQVIPEDVKITQGVDINKIYILARNLEEYLSQTVQGNQSIINIDNSLYYTGSIDKFEVSFILYQKDEPIFAALFLASEKLPSDLINPNDLAKFVAQEIGAIIGLKLNTNTYKSFGDTYFKISGGNNLSLVENFEKTQLGQFLYLLHIRDKFKGNPNVCVVISELDPLISRVKEIETNLVRLSESEFISKFPSYSKTYKALKVAYQTKKIYQFRLDLLIVVLSLSSPAITADYDKLTEKVSLKVSKTFDSLFKKCTVGTARFIISFINFDAGTEHHANVIMVDKTEKVAERYEPNGFAAIEENYTFGIISQQLDEQISAYFAGYSYSYISPSNFCPKIGIQGLESIFSKNTGFCVSWSVVYAEERLMSKLPRTYIAQNLLEDILVKYKLRGYTPEETGKNVESWMERRIGEIFYNMEAYYAQLSTLLDIHVKYNQIKDSGVSCLVLQ